jgi:hypothetical protein
MYCSWVKFHPFHIDTNIESYHKWSQLDNLGVLDYIYYGLKLRKKKGEFNQEAIVKVNSKHGHWDLDLSISN